MRNPTATRRLPIQVQALGTVAYQPKTPGLWVNQGGTVLLRVTSDMIAVGSPFDSFSLEGAIIMSQPFTLVSQNPNTDIDNSLRTIAQRYGVWIPYLKGDRVDSFVDIQTTAGVWGNQNTGEIYRVFTPQTTTGREDSRIQRVQGRTEDTPVFVLLSPDPYEMDVTIRELARNRQVPTTI
ncbi:MAG: hypothetical protein AAB518_00180 [Patescibacteria group bacterium]